MRLRSSRRSTTAAERTPTLSPGSIAPWMQCWPTGWRYIIDLHPSDNYKQQLRTSNDAVDRTAMLWRRLAAHYAERDPDRVFFEIMNEPEVNDQLPLDRHPAAAGCGHSRSSAAADDHRNGRGTTRIWRTCLRWSLWPMAT